MAHPKLYRQRMLQWIRERLDVAAPTPTDAEICERFGFDSTEHARTLLAELADAGDITIRGYGDGRQVTLGRARTALQPATRPDAAVKKFDAGLDQDVARIMSIVRRGGSPAPIADAPAAPVTPHQDTQEEEQAMGLQADVRNITIQARGELREIIEQRAREGNIALGRAAQDLVEAALMAEDALAVSKGEPDLTNVPSVSLISEIGRRMADDARELTDAALARAESAEGQVATLRAQVAALIEQKDAAEGKLARLASIMGAQ